MTSGRRMKYFSFWRVAMASTPPSKRNASGPSFKARRERRFKKNNNNNNCRYKAAYSLAISSLCVRKSYSEWKTTYTFLIYFDRISSDNNNNNNTLVKHYQTRIVSAFVFVCRFTSSGVRLVAGPGDLGRLLHLVARLVARRPISAQSDHATCETGQVTHLMLQKPPLPLRYVGEPTARLPHQVGFYCLKDKE